MASKRSVTIKGQDCELIPARPLRTWHFPSVLHSPPIPNWKLTLPAVPLFSLSVSQASAKDQFYEAMGASVSSAFQQAKSFVTMLFNSAKEEPWYRKSVGPFC